MGGRRRVQGSATVDSAHSPTSVPVAAIAHNPRNPRDDYGDVSELADSITEFGVLQPLGIVRYEIFLGRYPEYEAEIGAAHWVVMQGNRRLAAAIKAHLVEVPVVVQDRLGREDVFDESSLIENVHRTDLPPLREAALLRELLSKYGSQRQLAGKLKKSQGYISQRLSLLELVPELQDALGRGVLTVWHARDLASLPQERQRRVAAAGPPYCDPDVIPEDPGASTNPGGDYAVITPSADGAGPALDGRGPVEAEDVEESEQGSAVATFASRKRTLPMPQALARRLMQEYTAEERCELARLLQA